MFKGLCSIFSWPRCLCKDSVPFLAGLIICSKDAVPYLPGLLICSKKYVPYLAGLLICSRIPFHIWLAPLFVQGLCSKCSWLCSFVESSKDYVLIAGLLIYSKDSVPY